MLGPDWKIPFAAVDTGEGRDRWGSFSSLRYVLSVGMCMMQFHGSKYKS